MPVAIKEDDSDKYYWYSYDTINFVGTLKHIFGEDEALDIMVLYGKYIEKGFEIDQLDKFFYDENISKNDYLNQIDDRIYQYIINGQMKYDGYMSDHFKNKYPTLFLDSNVSDDIKKKFYLKLIYDQGYYFVIDPSNHETFISTKNIQDIAAWLDSTTITIHHK